MPRRRRPIPSLGGILAAATMAPMMAEIVKGVLPAKPRKVRVILEAET